MFKNSESNPKPIKYRKRTAERINENIQTQQNREPKILPSFVHELRLPENGASLPEINSGAKSRHGLSHDEAPLGKGTSIKNKFK